MADRDFFGTIFNSEVSKNIFSENCGMLYLTMKNDMRTCLRLIENCNRYTNHSGVNDPGLWMLFGESIIFRVFSDTNLSELSFLDHLLTVTAF